jgi:hypothetical protein
MSLPLLAEQFQGALRQSAEPRTIVKGYVS